MKKGKRYSRNSRGEFITVSFLIKIIIAVIAIFVILAFGAKIWSALFPSGDKNTIKSFNSLYSLMNSMHQSNLPYDSGTVSLYLADDHRIFLFTKDNSIKCGKKTLYKPTYCETGKNCLCLYDDDPEFDNAKDRDNNVARCQEFNTEFIAGEFQINSGDDCKIPDTAPFFTVIIAAMKDKNRNTKVLHVWLNNDDMRRVDTELKKPVCPQDNTVCSLQKDGTYTTQKFYYNNVGDFGYEDMLQSDKYNAYDKTFDECNKQRNPTIIAKCNYEPTMNKCELECLSPQIQCGVTYKTCEDFNEKTPGSQMTGYIRSNTQNSFLCSDNKRICTPSLTCFTLISEHYNCQPGKESECKDFIDGSAYNGFNIVRECGIKLGPYSNLNKNRITNQPADLFNYGDIIGFYDKSVTDTTNQKTYSCKTEVQKNFQIREVLSCRDDKNRNTLNQCLQFIMVNPAPIEKIQKLIDECEMKIAADNNIIITYDYKKSSDCDKRIAEYFVPLMRCSTTDIDRFAVPPQLPP
jgi:hypothetical protein